MIKKFWNSIFLSEVFFIYLAITVAVFTFGHFYPLYEQAGKIMLNLGLIAVIIDAVVLYARGRVLAERSINPILSNGDENVCEIRLQNEYGFKINLKLFDEIPFQLDTSFSQGFSMSPYTERTVSYTIVPKQRGEYHFGNIIIMLRTPLRFVKRRIEVEAKQSIAVYPSYVKLNKYSFKNFGRFSNDFGNQKTRRIGHSTEFEQIKEYVQGDGLRHVNWKASAKRNQLMVNQYTEEKSQQIYTILDSGRSMEMPFNGMTLLDYAINASLALSHVVVRNQDKAGVMYFNKKVEQILPADRSMVQLNRVMNFLYSVETQFYESDFEKLYADVKFKIGHRSLFILFTNFEDIHAMRRQLPYLRSIAKNSVLVVVLFTNTELMDRLSEPIVEEKNYYEKAITEKMMFNKKLMVKELNNNGINTLLTAPEELTTNTINKYLEIKAKGII